MKNTVKRLALLLGVIAASTFSATAQQGPGNGPRPGGPGGPGARGPREVPAEVLKKFDKDGDGKLNAEERKAAADARKAEWEALTPEERKKKTAERKAEMEERRAEFEKLTPEERKAEMEKRMTARFDKDRDGKLSDDEKAAMDKAMEDMQKRMQDRGGRPGRGGPGGPGKGGDKGGDKGGEEAPKG